MSLVLNIYTKNESSVTSESLRKHLRAQPNFKEVGDKGELMYENDATGVYFMLGNEPVIEPANGYRSLEFAFIINYLRPGYFGLEIFPVISQACSDLDLLLDNEQQGNPKKYTQDALYKEWLNTNDAALNSGQMQPSDKVALTSRKSLNELWEFNLKRRQLEIELLKKHLDIYVARLLYFRNAKDSKLVTAAAWPDCIPIILPPHTDYVFMMQKRKGLFKSGHDIKGYISVKRLQKEFPELFKLRADGSLVTHNAFARKNSKAILSTAPDLPADTDTFKPVTSDHIKDSG